MITPSNYSSEIKKVNINQLHPTLQEGHKFFEKAHHVYNRSPAVKVTIDHYLQKLNKAVEKAKSKKEPEAGKKTPTTTRRVINKSGKKEANRAKNSEKRTEKPEKRPKKTKSILKPFSLKVEHLDPEVKFIKRFVAFHGKEKKRAHLVSYYKSIAKAVEERVITKKSKYADLIKYILDSLYKVINTTSAESIHITINPEKLEQLQKAASREKVYDSVMIIKRFIGLMDKDPDKKVRTSILKAIGKIDSRDPYFKKLQEIKKNLSGSGKIVVPESQLAGLRGILSGLGIDVKYPAGTYKGARCSGYGVYPDGEICGGCSDCSKKPAAAGKKKSTQPGKAIKGKNFPLFGVDPGAFIPTTTTASITKPNNSLPGFISISNVEKASAGRPAVKTFTLPGDIGKLLGNLERYQLAITIEGDQGGGKTRFTYQLADAFAEAEHSVGIFSLEIGSGSTLVQGMRDEYIKPSNRSKVLITDKYMSPDPVKSIKDLANHFDVIIVDSFGKLNAETTLIDELRNQFPNTIFVFIFQRTTAKTIRGGTAPLFDCGINLVVVKSDLGFHHNYAHASKNRYQEDDSLRYNISSKKLILPEEEKSEPAKK